MISKLTYNVPELSGYKDRYSNMSYFGLGEGSKLIYFSMLGKANQHAGQRCRPRFGVTSANASMSAWYDETKNPYQ